MHGNKLHDIRLTISLPRDDDPSIVALCIYIHKTLGSSWTLSVESDDGKRGADEQVRRATALRPELHGTEAEGSQLHGCACLLLFVLFLGGWAFIAQYAIRNGDLNKLLVPTDSFNRKCGMDSGVLNKKNLFFFDLNQCIDPLVPITGCDTPQVRYH